MQSDVLHAQKLKETMQIRLINRAPALDGQMTEHSI